MDTALLGTSSGNAAAQHLFATLGFHTVERLRWYIWEAAAGPAASQLMPGSPQQPEPPQFAKEGAMESSDMHGLVDQILRQLREAGERAARTGILIALPKYFDAAEVQALQPDMNQKSVLQYDVTHRRGERRVWVQLR